MELKLNPLYPGVHCFHRCNCGESRLRLIPAAAARRKLNPQLLGLRTHDSTKRSWESWQWKCMCMCNARPRLVLSWRTRDAINMALLPPQEFHIALDSSGKFISIGGRAGKLKFSRVEEVLCSNLNFNVGGKSLCQNRFLKGTQSSFV